MEDPVGDYRIIYTIDDKTRSVSVWAIGHRRLVYDLMGRRWLRR
ncbi:MAG: type II toxin-antitoxin system RelE/ParE family toxin [Candidatus Rokubacteria bacterium]|nr:type II toxin-antitoxin system RelE/ParE family toxin [Candidatus Rokubacteria bacterium]